MKIYPSKHRIKQIAESNIDKDITIPLAYLNNEHVTYSITRKVHDDFSNTIKTPVLPNQLLEHEDILLFDNFGNPANSSTVINRIEDKYYYYPNNMTEFNPLKFTYSVVAQRQMNYSISSKFNINVTCIDDEKKMDFINRMSKILIAPSDKKYLPNNITINGNKTDIKTLKSIDYENTNFVFIESNDGLKYNFDYYDPYVDEESETPLNDNSIAYNTFLDSNINTWIISDEHYKYPMVKGLGFDVVLKNPVITSSKKYHIKDYYNITDTAFTNVKVHNLFENDVCPILIIENENQGFTIYSSPELFSEANIDTYKNLIYEVMMYVYCNSYKKSRPVDEYITYTLPDYEVISGSLRKKTSFISKTNLSDLLKINVGKFKLCEVHIADNNVNLAVPDADLVNTVDDILCVGVSNNKLVFKLNDANKDKAVYQEPVKPTGWTSIYFNNKIYYLEQIHYFMESNIGKQEDQENKLFLIEKDVDLHVRLYPFKSSKYGLNITKDIKTVIPFIKTTVNGVERIKNESYVLYINLNTNALGFVYESEYEESKDKAYLALITITEQKSDQYLTDMRLKGGGLPEDMPDNFNLLDIGHIYGRPYRQANTLVITLPKKYEPYKNEILEVINKYKVAEDYPVLFFEDDETDGEI
jgi:hypothetical protein